MRRKVRAILAGDIFTTRKAYETEKDFLITSLKVSEQPVYDRFRKLFTIPTEVVVYSPDENLVSLVRFKGTAVFAALCRPELWILLIFHVVVSCMYYKVGGHKSVNGVSTAKNWPAANMTLVSIPGSILVFGLVFFINQTYKRYLQQYLHCKMASTFIGECIMYLRSNFEDGAFTEARDVRHHITKLLNAAHLLAYAGLPQYRGIGVHFWAYQYLLENKILTDNQVNRIKELMECGQDGRLAFREVMSWAMRSIWGQVGKKHIADTVGTKYSNNLFQIQSNLDALYMYSDGPVPFEYHHHLHLVLAIYLFLLGYTFVFQTAYYSTIAYFLILLAFISARELGDMMADPFGSDDLDIPVFSLVEATFQDSLKLVECSPFKDTTPSFLQKSDDAYPDL